MGVFQFFDTKLFITRKRSISEKNTRDFFVWNLNHSEQKKAKKSYVTKSVTFGICKKLVLTNCDQIGSRLHLDSSFINEVDHAKKSKPLCFSLGAAHSSLPIYLFPGTHSKENFRTEFVSFQIFFHSHIELL